MDKHDNQVKQTPKSGLFYGYVIVIASFVLMLLVFGINYSFSIFFKPLLTEFSWTRAGTSGAYSLMTLVAGFLGIFAGKLSDLFGPKILGIASGVFLGIGFLLMSQAQAIWQIYLIYGLVIAAGIGGAWPILMPTVARWFVRQRGLMTGIVASGIGAGIISIPSLGTWLIAEYDWRSTYIIIGTLTLVLIIIVSFFLKSDPSKMGLTPLGEEKTAGSPILPKSRAYSLSEAIRTKDFAVLCIVFFCFGFCLHAIMVHIVKHTTETGISEINAATILIIIGALNCTGRILMAGASDKIGIKLSLVIGFALMAFSLFWLETARELWSFYLFAIIFGFAYGGIIAFMALAPAQIFGLTSLGVILGVVTFAYTIGGATGPAFTGFIYDITNSYNLAFLVLGIIAVIGCVLVFLLKSSSKNETRKAN